MRTTGSRLRQAATGVGIAAVAALASGTAGGRADAAAPAGNAVPRCVSAQLTAQVAGDRQVGAQHGQRFRDYTIMRIVNSSAATCLLRGYPAVQVFDAAGTRTSKPARHRGHAASAEVVLAPDAAAQFEIHDLYTAAARCQGDVDGSLRITVPHTAPLTVLYYGYSACDLSVTTVHAPPQ